MQMKATKSCTIHPPSGFQSKRKACSWGLRWRGKYRYRSKSPGLVWFIWQSSSQYFQPWMWQLLSFQHVAHSWVPFIPCGVGVSSLFSPVHDWHEQEGNVETIETVLRAEERCLIFFWTWPHCSLLRLQARSLLRAGRTRASSLRFNNSHQAIVKGWPHSHLSL